MDERGNTGTNQRECTATTMSFRNADIGHEPTGDGNCHPRLLPTQYRLARMDGHVKFTAPLVRPHLRVLPAIVLSTLVVALCPAIAAQDRGGGERWIGTWATGVMARPPQGPNPPASGLQSSVNIKEQTLRQIVHVSLGGERVRVVFSNTFGTEPLLIGSASVARHDKEASIIDRSARRRHLSGG